MRTGAARPWVVAHRGASGDRLENTLAAFDEALAQGADGIELDVQLSADGVPVVWHDWTLRRAAAGRTAVGRLDLESLRRLEPGAQLDSRFHGQHIPTLEEVFSRYGRRTRLLVELKLRRTAGEGPLVRAVVSAVRRMRLEDDVLVLAFDPRVLAAAAVEAPRLGRVLNLDPPRRMTRKLEALLPGLAALSANVRKLTPAFSRDLARHRRPLFVYTCNTTASVERALDCSAAAIMSDRPAWLAATIARTRDGNAA